MKQLLILRMTSILCILALLSFKAQAVEKTTIVQTTYNGFEAYRLSDGKTEAVVVPALSARVLRYGTVGGPNWLWNGATEKKPGVWSNWGGDKVFIGPHSLWKLGAAEIWPPQTSWDGTEFQAEILPEARLKTTGPAWTSFDIAITREFSFGKNGNFVIRQTLEKKKGDPLFAAIWNVSQAATPDAVFLPVNPQSAYEKGFAPFGDYPIGLVRRVLPNLLHISPAPGATYKLGVDARVATIAAMKNGMLWLQHDCSAGRKNSDIYGEGQDGKPGFPVEFYNHSDSGAGHYVELELLSPMHPFTPGARWEQTLSWSMHHLPSSDVNAPQTRQKIQSLLWTTL